MKDFLDKIFFSNASYNAKTLLAFAVGFPFLTYLALGIDSAKFAVLFFDGRQITNVLAIIYFLLFFWFSNSYLRQLLFVMVFLSYIGELIFCNLLEMYHYRTPTIPLYVPFGHAIVYGSGYVFADTNWAIKKDSFLRMFFTIGFFILFLAVGILANDYFSLIFGIFFFLILKRKKMQNLYYFIALCVIYIELVGTYFQCWTWVPKTFDVIPAANPPMGAVFFYAGGDVLLSKIVNFWKKEELSGV